MHGAPGEVLMDRLRARRIQPRATARGPAMHHRVGHIGMELQAEGVAELERLHREIIAGRKQVRAVGQSKALAMPMIDARRPVRAKGAARVRRTDRVVTDLDTALRMRRDARAELPRQHLRTEADAEERTLLAQRNGNPVDLAPDIVVGIVGAHRAAADHRAGMHLERVGQRIAEARTADVEGVAQRTQRVADPAGSRGLLMQHDQHRP
ncbi:hypothetical protein chiPu_0027705 [Chiloscyllium punctatum]|uniref:Uncharacterized protein n=1 Tax=Chiloscyllium punctatum TaxID=137246 RepID=A0A401TM89_CHIPU|nr:hypothetical protein [Chiloscyllium punctatum]